MKFRTKMIGLLAITLAMAGGSTAAIAATTTTVQAAPIVKMDPWEGFECQSVFSSGGWIRSCVLVNPDTSPVAELTRVAGASRYDTAALLSQQSYLPSVPVVYIANGLTLVDALAAASADPRGPVLMVPASGTLPESVRAELARLDPQSIVIAGGEDVVSPDIAAQVAAAAAQ